MKWNDISCSKTENQMNLLKCTTRRKCCEYFDRKLPFCMVVAWKVPLGLRSQCQQLTWASVDKKLDEINASEQMNH